MQDRIVFDKACKKYQKWVTEEREKLALQSEHKANGVVSDARNSSSTPDINSSIHRSATAITRSYSSPESTFQNANDDGTTPLTDIPLPCDPAIRPSAQSSPSAPHLIPELPPSQKLSRSLRVFVAWKANP